MEKVPKSRRSKHGDFTRSPKLSVGSIGSDRVFFDYSYKKRSVTLEYNSKISDISKDTMPNDSKQTRSPHSGGGDYDARKQSAGVDARHQFKTNDLDKESPTYFARISRKRRASSLDISCPRSASRSPCHSEMTPGSEHKRILAEDDWSEHQQQQQEELQEEQEQEQKNDPSDQSPQLKLSRSTDKYNVLHDDDDYYDCPTTPDHYPDYNEYGYRADLQIRVLPTVSDEMPTDLSFYKDVDLDGTGPDDIDIDLDFTREDLPVSCVDIIANIASITSYLLDVGSDIWVAILYWKNGHTWWFIFTMTAIVVPSLIMTVFSLSWYIQVTIHIYIYGFIF